MNPLENLPKVRQVLYTLQWVLSGVMMLIAVGFAAAQAGLPHWYGIAAAILSAFWAYTGITASSNINQPKE